MSGRLLPDKEHFEEVVRDRITEELAKLGLEVVTTSKGDVEDVPFDWLFKMRDGSCIGLEVVRAEDEDQVRHLEREHKAGAVVITGTAEMPWESIAGAVAKKSAKTAAYRKALDSLCAKPELHLGITSGAQDLVFEGELADYVKEVAGAALESFDVVWLVHGELTQRID